MPREVCRALRSLEAAMLTVMDEKDKKLQAELLVRDNEISKLKQESAALRVRLEKMQSEGRSRREGASAEIRGRPRSRSRGEASHWPGSPLQGRPTQPSFPPPGYVGGTPIGK